MVIYNITYNRSSQSIATIDEYQDELYEAAANGHTPRVLRLLARQGVKLDKPDLNGMTALHHACLSGFQDTVEAILRAGARIDYESPVYGTPLCLAVLKEREDLVEELLRQRANPDGPGGRLGSALHAACHVGNKRLVQALIKERARVDLTRTIRWQDVSQLRNPDTDEKYPALTEGQPLVVAAWKGLDTIVNILLDHGADINVPYREWNSVDFAWQTYDEADPTCRKSGQTAIYRAAADHCVGVLETLIRHGADFRDIEDSQGTTLVVAATAAHQLEAMRVLIREGARFSLCASEDAAPLHYAAVSGFVAGVELLIASGADVNASEPKCASTPLMLAAGQGHVECLKILAKKEDANLDMQDKSGRTALMWASLSLQTRSVQALLHRKARTEIPAHNGDTALHTAAYRGHIEAVRLLLDAGAKPGVPNHERRTPLHDAAAEGQIEIVQLLANKGVQLESRDKHDSTPLHLAAFKGQVQAVRLLAGKGVDLDKQDSDGLTALMVALRYRHTECVQALLDQGARQDICDHTGCSALLTAAMSNNSDGIELLLHHDGKKRSISRARKLAHTHTGSCSIIDAIVPQLGSTVLYLAASQGRVEAVRALLQHGANCELVGCIDLTASSIAAWQNHRDVLEVLFEYHASKAPPALCPKNWPLPRAAQGGHLELVIWLLSLHPADSKDTAVQTAIDLARQHERKEVLEYLLSEQTAGSLSEEQ